MIPAGAAALDMVEYRGRRRAEEVSAREAHAVRRSSRTSRARSTRDREHVRAARLQHREPRGRPDRAARHLAHHAARRLRASTRSSRSRSRCTSSSTCCASRELAPGESVERELRADHGRGAARAARRADRARPRSFGARVADVGRDAIVFELVGAPEEIDAFEELVRPHGVQRARPHRAAIGLRRAPRAARQSRSQPSRPRLEPRKEHITWRRSTATATSTSSTARSRSSATAARVTRTRSTCTTPASRSRSACARAARRGPRPRRPGSTVAPVAEAVRGAQLVAILAARPACSRRSATSEVAPNLEPGAALLFAHGFNVHYGRIAPPAGPRRDHGRAEGRRATSSAALYTEGYGTPALVAVAQDASGSARELALAYGAGDRRGARRA